jgi:hypothetical protein
MQKLNIQEDRRIFYLFQNLVDLQSSRKLYINEVKLNYNNLAVRQHPMAFYETENIHY